MEILHVFLGPGFQFYVFHRLSTILFFYYTILLQIKILPRFRTCGTVSWTSDGFLFHLSHLHTKKEKEISFVQNNLLYFQSNEEEHLTKLEKLVKAILQLLLLMD